MIKKLKRHLLFFAFIVFLIILIFATYKDYGITWDEGAYLIVGHHYTRQILNALHIPNNLSPNVLLIDPFHYLSHGVFFEVLITLLTLLLKNFTYETYHLLKALLAISAFIFLYLIIFKLSKNYWLAVLSMILLLLFPHFYGDIFNNPIDVPSATLFVFCIFAFINYLFHHQQFSQLLLFSLTLALAINERIVFWYVFFLSVFIFVIISVIEKKKINHIVKQLFLLIFFTLVFLHLTQPYLFTHPLTGIIDMFKTSKGYPFFAANLFDGQFIPANALPWYYIPKLIAITTPLSTLALFIIGNFYLLFLILNRQITLKQKTIYIYILSLFYLPLIIIFIFKPTLYDSWRHFLFLTIPLIIIAIFGITAVSRIKYFPIKFVLFSLIAINLLSTGWEMKVLHPYQYIYYNSLVGGLKGAYKKYETDYWGAGFKEATEWFNTHINDPKKTYRIFAEGYQYSSDKYFKENATFTYDFERADYIFTFTRWNADQKHSGKIIYTVEREGVPLIYIKEGSHKN